MNRKLPALLLVTALIGGTAQAATGGEATQSTSYSIGITGFVPVICRATFDTTVVPAVAGETPLGALSEFCNSPNGYQILVHASPELAGSTLTIGGQSVSLSGEGPTLVVASAGPDIVSRNVSLSSPDGAAGSLSFQIVAL